MSPVFTQAYGSAVLQCVLGRNIPGWLPLCSQGLSPGPVCSLLGHVICQNLLEKPLQTDQNLLAIIIKLYTINPCLTYLLSICPLFVCYLSAIGVSIITCHLSTCLDLSGSSIYSPICHPPMCLWIHLFSSLSYRLPV